MGVSPGAVCAWVVLPGHTDLTEPGLGINLVTRRLNQNDNDARVTLAEKSLVLGVPSFTKSAVFLIKI